MSTKSTTERPTVLALGLLVTELSLEEGVSPVVAEGVLPEGASPPLHVHQDLDDSFYLLEGTMVLRCGEDVSLAGPGTWVPFPTGVPHTFRVMDGPARILLVHANDTFMGLLRDVGQPAGDGVGPTTRSGPEPDELNRLMEEHGITTVGPCMEESEARALMASLAS